MRLFETERSIDNHFHLYPNRMTAPGDETKLHEHRHGHLAIFGPGQYEVTALVGDEEISVPLTDFGYAYIRPRTKHRIRFLGGADEGRFVCVFSHFDAQGQWWPDPKV